MGLIGSSASNMLCVVLPALLVFIFARYSASETIEVDVLILGGGISGITAAKHLNTNNVTSFLVLEAQDYIGGRLKNLTVGNATVSEGANWLSFVELGDKNPILVIAEMLKLSWRVSDYEDIVVKNAVNNDTDVEAASAELYAAQEKVSENQKKMPLCEDRPISSSMADVGWVPDTPLKSSVEWYYYDYEYATGAKTVSTKLFDLGSDNQTDAIVTDPRGYATIIQYLAQNFKNKIKTGKAVRSVNYSDKGVEVETSDGSLYKAKYALCTFSTGVLAVPDFVKFSPKLPSWKRQAVNNLPMGYFTFVIVRFEDAFWDDNEFLLNAGQIRAKFPVIFNRNSETAQPGSKLLMFVAIGDDAIRTETQPQSKTVDEVLDTLRQMYPDVNISYPTDVVVSKWVTNPYTRGSYSNPVVGDSKADFHNLQGRVGNLFFAGEASDENYYGFLQGGYFSGEKQAKAIVNCLHEKECPMYVPEKNEDHCTTDNADRRLVNRSLKSILVLTVVMAFYLFG